MSITRRGFVSSVAASSAIAVAAGGTAMAADKKAPVPALGKPVPPGQHPIRPLPFAPGKLSGLSEKLLVSHHENNYSGAVKNLNKVEAELQNVGKDTPGYLVAGLRERELTYTNSMILHEHYFGNLGGPGKISGAIEKALAGAFGSVARWEELFRATGMILGGGSGWAILDLNFATGDLRTYWAGGHSQSVAFGQPLLVLDMFEHAYALDYGAAHAKYVDAFFANLRWDEVNARFARGVKAARLLAE